MTRKPKFDPRELGLHALRNRVYQALARSFPGGRSMRVRLHRARGVRVGENVWIGYDAIIETSHPWLVEIGDDVSIGVRTTIIAHFNETEGVRIERGAYIGAGALIMPSVVIGEGAVVAAGSVVTRSVPPLTVVQGNPATPIAKTGAPMGTLSVKAFSRQLKPISSFKPRAPAQPE